MTYDFDKVIDRRATNATKWDIKENELPMWIADMDFETAPEIMAAIQARAAHGDFGYTDLTPDWQRAVCLWWHERHHFDIAPDWLIFTTGVIPAISTCVRKLTTPAEKVVVQTPVYNIFFNSIVNNGRNILESPLHYDGEKYDIDFADLEKKLSDPQTTMMILCNPHNPVGKIWDKETLAKIGDLCKKYGVVVLSDEIHCDLTDPKHEYIPFASVNDTCRSISVTCVAPTKTFNLAGLQTAGVIVPNAFLRHKVWRALNTDEVAEPNAFAVTAAVAAFTKGAPWLDALREYLYENKRIVREYIAENIPEIKVTPSDATYLLWLDCRRVTDDASALADQLREKTGLILNKGASYGESGRLFLRLNTACPRTLLYDGLRRLRDGIRD